MNLKNILNSSCCDVRERLIKNNDDLMETVSVLKKIGYRIGLVGGGFDLLHVGHCRYLSEAKEI